MMTRDEHLAWAKRRALEYVDAGMLVQAVTSMGSDLNGHPETRGLVSGDVLAMQLPGTTEDIVRIWIESFR